MHILAGGSVPSRAPPSLLLRSESQYICEIGERWSIHQDANHEEQRARPIADIVFNQADAAPDGLKIRPFDRFKPLQRLDIAIIGPQGQSASMLVL
jgi:hypothetical protein